MADRLRHKNAEWNFPKAPSKNVSFEVANLAVQQDIRDALLDQNRLLAKLLARLPAPKRRAAKSRT